MQRLNFLAVVVELQQLQFIDRAMDYSVFAFVKLPRSEQSWARHQSLSLEEAVDSSILNYQKHVVDPRLRCDFDFKEQVHGSSFRLKSEAVLRA